MLLHACCLDDYFSKCSYIDYRTYILFVDIIIAIVDNSIINRFNFVIINTRFISTAIIMRYITSKLKKTLKIKNKR